MKMSEAWDITIAYRLMRSTIRHFVARERQAIAKSGLGCWKKLSNSAKDCSRRKLLPFD